MCDEAIAEYPYSLQYVCDWFVTQERVKIWHDDDYYSNVNEIVEWYDHYEKRKNQKSEIKEELIPIAWHTSRWWDWCIPEDDKKETRKFRNDK